MRRLLLALDPTDAYVRVPEEAVVAVLGPAAHSLSKIDWNGSTLRVFTVDLIERTEVIADGGRPSGDVPERKRQGLGENETIQVEIGSEPLRRIS